MSIQVTLSLPEQIVERAERFGQATQRHTEDVLAETLEMMWPTLADEPLPAVSQLGDGELLSLADSKMDAVQNRRLGKLQEQGKALGLTLAERYELLALLQIYEMGLLRKSEALAEAVQRGLREPRPG